MIVFWLGLLAAINYVPEVGIPFIPEWTSLVIRVIAVVMIYLLFAINAIGWQRMLGNLCAHTQPFAALRELRLWSYIWRAMIMLVPAIAVAFIVSAPISAMDGSILQFDPPHSNLVDWMVIHTKTYFEEWLSPFLVTSTLTLLGFIFPAVALGHKMTLWAALKASLTYAPRMFVALIYLEVMTFLVIEIAGSHLNHQVLDSIFWGSFIHTWGSLALISALSALSLTIKIAILTTAYLHWHAQQKRSAEADLSKVFS